MSAYGQCEKCGHKGKLTRGLCRNCAPGGYVKPNSWRPR